jgi:hypothetical protein
MRGEKSSPALSIQPSARLQVPARAEGLPAIPIREQVEASLMVDVEPYGTGPRWWLSPKDTTPLAAL